MKKVLLGLLAISAISMSAPITNEMMNADTVDKSSVFGTGQTGVVKVHGHLVSTVPTLKYVVYTGAADGTGVLEDTLTLPEFTLSQTASENIFDATVVMPTIYVKKIGTLGATPSDRPILTDLTTESVTFKVKLDAAHTAIPAIGTGITEKGSIEIQPTAFYTKAHLETLLPIDGSLKVSTKGLFEEVSGGATYQTPNSIYGTSPAKGQFRFEVKGKTGVWGATATGNTVKNVETKFATKQNFTHVTVEAVVGL